MAAVLLCMKQMIKQHNNNNNMWKIPVIIFKRTYSIKHKCPLPQLYLLFGRKRGEHTFCPSWSSTLSLEVSSSGIYVSWKKMEFHQTTLNLGLFPHGTDLPRPCSSSICNKHPPSCTCVCVCVCTTGSDHGGMSRHFQAKRL